MVNMVGGNKNIEASIYNKLYSYYIHVLITTAYKKGHRINLPILKARARKLAKEEIDSYNEKDDAASIIRRRI